MWMVELALQCPYTFIIPAILLLLLGGRDDCPYGSRRLTNIDLRR
jgi:hypothetical protein